MSDCTTAAVSHAASCSAAAHLFERLLHLVEERLLVEVGRQQLGNDGGDAQQHLQGH
jgi:hypothetical protein